MVAWAQGGIPTTGCVLGKGTQTLLMRVSSGKDRQAGLHSRNRGWSAPTFWWGITGSGDWIGGAAVEMAMGRLDLEKPETRASEDTCSWPAGETERWTVESQGPSAHQPMR